MPFDRPPAYPPTRRDENVADRVHGEEIRDPYRWLEDTTSEETKEWVREQNALTEAILAAVPARKLLRERLTELWDFPRVGVPFERGGRWFQIRNTGLQPQSVLHVMAAPTATGRVLLDPNTLSSDGTVALSSWSVSHDGSMLAYATSAAGSDWLTWRFRDVDTGEDLADELTWSKFSGAAWSGDLSSVYYAALDPPSRGHEFLAESRIPRIMRHVLGTSQDDDTLVYTAADEPEWLPSVDVTDDGRWLVLTIDRGTFPENQLHVLDLSNPDASLQPIAPDFSGSVALVGNAGATFYLCTDRDAPRRRIVAVDVSTPHEWREVVPEADDTLEGASLYGGHLVAHYLHDAASRLAVHALDGTMTGAIRLPAFVSVTELSGHADDPVVHIGVTSFTDSGSVWRHDLATATTEQVVPPGSQVDTAALHVEQVFVPSKDGTRVPVFLMHRGDVTPTGDVPVLLYGYGGFNVALTPAFSVTRAVWAERGGLLAVANLRGGGEYGREWYDAGRRDAKQNVFDDFMAVADWLGGASGWSRPERVAINGGSNGGLLVGACLTQRPELFGAAVPAVGVLDMLRFHKFTIGWAWVSDYGDPDDPHDYRSLRAYSPLHNIRAGTSYPPTLVLTGDHDDRVAPGHSFKFAAALQAAQTGAAPVLIRVETSAGHGAGKPTQKLIDEAADLLTFVEQALDV